MKTISMIDLEKQIIHQIEKSANILLVFPENDGSGHGYEDSLASSLALYMFLTKSGKKVCLTCSHKNSTSVLSFLPAYDKIENSLENIRDFIVSVNIEGIKIHKVRYTLADDQISFIISPQNGIINPPKTTAVTSKFKHDLIITVGARNLESLGDIYSKNVDFFYETPVINIDCQAANEDFGQINYVDLSAISSAEIVYSLLKNIDSPTITPDIATCLLAGIMQQTNNFKNTRLTPRLLITTSDLIDCGSRREEIIDHLYKQHDLPSLKLWGEILNKLVTDKERGLAWAVLDSKTISENNLLQSQISHLIEELIASVPSIKLVAIFIAKAGHGSTVWLYSLKNIDSLQALDSYHPSGHKRLATAFLPLSPDKAALEVTGSLQAYLDKLTS